MGDEKLENIDPFKDLRITPSVEYYWPGDLKRHVNIHVCLQSLYYHSLTFLSSRNVWQQVDNPESQESLRPGIMDSNAMQRLLKRSKITGGIRSTTPRKFVKMVI